MKTIISPHQEARVEGSAGSEVAGRASRAKPPKLWLTRESERQENEQKEP